MPGAGRLVLVATPIGNLGDLSPRASAALRAADVVAAEDTRRSRVLLDHVGVRPRMLSYHDHNEAQRTPQLLDLVEQGQVVVVVTDAGTPGLADPGFRLVRAAVARGIAVEGVPGPAAALQALLLSGLPMDRFAFEGFLPRKPSARRRRLQELAADPRTLVFYVAPHRALDELDALSQALGADRDAALARELTKLHEEVWRATLGELVARARAGVRGEVTVVVAGASPPPTPTEPEELAAAVARRVEQGSDKKTAISEVAAAMRVPRRVVYQAVLDAGP